MKALLGISIFGKEDMLGWIIDGIIDCFPPATTELRFIFDACTDHSEKNFLELAHTRLAAYRWSHIATDREIFEHGAHINLIGTFMASDNDVLVIPHDDNKFIDPGFLDSIERARQEYGDKLGWIGCRDGYDLCYANMISSPFSGSDKAADKLRVGCYMPRLMLNPGPNVYTRELIAKIGLPDADMPYYWWDDYSLRAHQAGLTNLLLSAGCLHEKFGKLQARTSWHDPQNVAKNLACLNDRWRPVFGRNVI